jgi:RHS repeat-associated protein
MKYTYQILGGSLLFLAVTVSSYGTRCGNNAQDGVAGSTDCDSAGVNLFDPYTGNVRREINDLELFFGVGETRLKWVRYGNSRSTNPKTPFGEAHNWRHEYEYEMADAGTNEKGQAQLTIRYPDGSEILFTQNKTFPDLWLPPPGIGQRLFQNATAFTLQMSNGFRYRFEQLTDSSGFTFFQLQQFLDSQQNVFELSYEPAGLRRLVKVFEPARRFLSITYGTVGDVPVITEVSTSDGRSVTYNYDVFNDGTATFVRLTGATYRDGTRSTYEYSQAEPGAHPVLAHAADPRVVGKAVDMRYEYDPSTNVRGLLWKELNGVTGETMATRTTTPSDIIVTYANGSTDTFTMPGAQEGQLNSETNSLQQTTLYDYNKDDLGFLIKQTDALNRVTRYTRSRFGNLLSITYPHKYGEEPATETWTRDDLDLVLTHTDERGFTTTFTRDKKHRVERIDYPDGTFETFTYNQFSEVVDHQLRNQGVEHFGHESLRGLQTWHTDAENNRTDYTYDSADRLASIKDARGNTTSYEYNERGLLTKVTNADVLDSNGKVIEHSFKTFDYDSFGNLRFATDELKHTWTTVFDNFRRLVDATDPRGRRTHCDYDLPGGICGCAHAEAKPTQITLPSGRAIAITYDSEWQKTTETIGFGSPDAATTNYIEYDAVGNLKIIQDPNKKLWKVDYDERNRKTHVTDPEGHTTEWTYDKASNIETIKRPGDVKPTVNQFDRMNRPHRITNPQGEVTVIDYDRGGNVQKLTDPRLKEYEYTYDFMDRKQSMKYPDLSTEQFTWDQVGNLLTYTTRAGQVCTYSYDNRNRKIGSSWSDGTPSISRTYDAASRVKTMSSSVSALSYTYDEANELLSETQAVAGGGSAKQVSYTYTLDGLRDRLTYPSGYVVTNDEYTGRNQVKKIKVDGVQLASYGYDSNGNRTHRGVRNTGVVDNVFDWNDDVNLFDGANRPTRVNLQRIFGPHGGEVRSLAQFDYGYDSVGRRAFVQRNADKGDVFKYDAIDQLIDVQYNATDPETPTPTDPSKTVHYDFDPGGNRQAVTENGVKTSFTPNALNQYTQVGASSLTYDQNGNLTGLDSTTYTYDAQNRLTSAVIGENEVNFAYDPLNRCVVRTINGVPTFFYFDGRKLIEERDSADVQIARYVNGAQMDEILSRITASGSIRCHYDAIGNVIALTDDRGVVREKYSYDVFGAPTITDSNGAVLTESAFGNRFMFTGREFIQQVGLYDFRNRFYSPELGRFLQPDPVGFYAGDYNLYRYVGNNPVNRIDPLGLEEHSLPDQLAKEYSVAWLIALYRTAREAVGTGMTLKTFATEAATLAGELVIDATEIGLGVAILFQHENVSPTIARMEGSGVPFDETGVIGRLAREAREKQQDMPESMIERLAREAREKQQEENEENMCRAKATPTPTPAPKR